MLVDWGLGTQVGGGFAQAKSKRMLRIGSRSDAPGGEFGVRKAWGEEPGTGDVHDRRAIYESVNSFGKERLHESRRILRNDAV
jgi:hypothetical protein